MYLCISGFLHDGVDDDSLKFELDLDHSHDEQIIQLLGHQSLNAMVECEWALTSEQVEKISVLIGRELPEDLQLFIGVEA